MKRYLRTMRGMAMGVVLMVVALAVLIAFSMASMSIFHLQITAHSGDAMCAQELAESEVARALAELAHDLKYETAGGGGLHDRTTSPSPGVTSVVAFDSVTAARQHMLVSCNNFAGTNTFSEPSVPYGSVSACPTGDVLVSAKATVHGVVKYATALVQFPSYQYVISANGPITSNGPLLVASTTATPSGGQLTSAQEAYAALNEGGNVASNSSDSGAPPALSLQSNDKIMGDAVAVGSISLVSSSQVLGNIRQFSAPVGVPTIQLSDFDPVTGGTKAPPSPSTLPTATITAGFTPPQVLYIDPSPAASVTVNGDLKLGAGTYIYVNGGLTVNGGIDGLGVVVVNGNTTINGGGAMTTNANAALISQGDVLMQGGGGASTSAAYEGLVYTNGNFTAKYITVVGAFVGGGLNSSLTLQNANVIADTSRSSISFPIVPAPPASSFTWTGPSQYFVIGTGLRIQVYEYTQAGQPVYASSLVTNAPPGSQSQMWSSAAAALLQMYQHGNPYSFSPCMVNSLRSGNWQNNWGSCPPGMSGISQPADVMQWITSNGPPPAGVGSPTPTPTATASGNNYTFDLDQFFATDDNTKVVIWEII